MITDFKIDFPLKCKNMTKETEKKCQVCGENFPLKELYPTTWIREPILTAASKKYPELKKEGFICFPDLRKISILQLEHTLQGEKKELSKLEQEVLDSVDTRDIFATNVNDLFEGKRTLGQKLADKVAAFGGSWTFISMFLLFGIGWITINTIQLLDKPFDPYPFILLNLALNCVAAMQAPIILMSQQRQAAKDRITQEKDYQTNLKSELELRHLQTRFEMIHRHEREKTHEMLEILKKIVQKT